MNDDDEKKAIAEQRNEIEKLRAKLDLLCEEKGYTLAQVCAGLKPVEYSLDARGEGNWDGLGSPKSWFLKATKLDTEAYWKLSPVERKKLLEGFHAVKA